MEGNEGRLGCKDGESGLARLCEWWWRWWGREGKDAEGRSEGGYGTQTSSRLLLQDSQHTHLPGGATDKLGDAKLWHDFLFISAFWDLLLLSLSLPLFLYLFICLPIFLFVFISLYYSIYLSKSPFFSSFSLLMPRYVQIFYHWLSFYISYCPCFNFLVFTFECYFEALVVFFSVITLLK